MTVLIRGEEPEVTEKLTEICRLLTIVLNDEWERVAGIVSHRAKMPGRDALPDGHCTFEYACNNPIKHWRYIHERNEWIPVCRRHQANPKR
jgi:hypothetical protein